MRVATSFTWVNVPSSSKTAILSWAWSRRSADGPWASIDARYTARIQKEPRAAYDEETSISPTMPPASWGMQKYSWVPSVSKVCDQDSPPGTLPVSSVLPLAE